MEKKIGASKGVLSRAIAKGTDIQAKWIESLVENYPQYSTNWLLTGQGPMLKNETDATASTDTSAVNPIDKVTNNPLGHQAFEPLTTRRSTEKVFEISEIPLYNIEASAGLQRLFLEGGELLGKISIPNAPRCDGAVYVIGDSMYPLLKAGDIIAFRQIMNLSSIIYGEIYILQLYNDGDLSIVVKYVKRSEKGDHYVKLVSYNKEHDPKDIPLTWIQSIARVTLAIRKFSIT